MHGQHQNGVSLTIPKDPVDKHKIYTVRGKSLPLKKHFYSLRFLSSLKRNPHLTSATVSLLSSLFATLNLHTFHKTFTLTHPSLTNLNL